jgi:PleD family two-component response regulator
VMSLIRVPAKMRRAGALTASLFIRSTGVQCPWQGSEWAVSNKKPEQTMTSSTPAPRLLVIDDEPEVRGLLAEYFTRHGFNVSLAPDAAAAREHLKTQQPDVLLLDVTMPGCA